MQQVAHEVAIALKKCESAPGMRIKPMEPDKYYLEIRIDDSNRTFLGDGARAVPFADVVLHNKTDTYGRKPPGAQPPASLPP